jgi:hypothetical protein
MRHPTEHAAAQWLLLQHREGPDQVKHLSHQLTDFLVFRLQSILRREVARLFLRSGRPGAADLGEREVEGGREIHGVLLNSAARAKYAPVMPCVPLDPSACSDRIPAGWRPA